MTDSENKQPTLQDIESKTYAPDELENAQGYISQVIQICDRESVEPVFNFDPAGELPEGYGISIIPLTERVVGSGNVTRGVCIAAMPSLATLAAEDSGAAFISKLVQTTLTKMVKLAATPKDDGLPSDLPITILDFTTSSRSSALAAFNIYATDYVKALKVKGLKFMNKAILRQSLTSAEFSDQMFPTVPQASWKIVLNSMIKRCKDDGIDSGILTHWMKTRDSIHVDTKDMDLSDIDKIMSSDDESEEVATESSQG